MPSKDLNTDRITFYLYILCNTLDKKELTDYIAEKKMDIMLTHKSQCQLTMCDHQFHENFKGFKSKQILECNEIISKYPKVSTDNLLD